MYRTLRTASAIKHEAFGCKSCKCANLLNCEPCFVDDGRIRHLDSQFFCKRFYVRWGVPDRRLVLYIATVGEGSRLRDTEVFGKQDPYAVITVGTAKQKTRVHKSKG